MFCTNCGAKLSDDARFCHVCGASLQPIRAVPEKPEKQEEPAEPVVPQSPDKEVSVDVPEEKGEFDGVVWDARVSVKKKATPKIITRIDPKPVEEEKPKKKKGCLFWGILLFLALVVVYVIYDYVTLH